MAASPHGNGSRAPSPPEPSAGDPESKPEQSAAPSDNEVGETSERFTKAQLRQATSKRKAFAISVSVLYGLAFLFLLMVVIGNTSDKPGLNGLWFYKLDLSDIIPQSVPNAVLINSIARSLGLHDFYQVGLWNFCEGYNDEGITYCSTPQRFYWFNPVEVLLNELLAGATIALPSTVNDVLGVVQVTTQIMFGFFVSGTVLTFVLALSSTLALQSRWWSGLLSFLALVDGICVVGASAVATVISVAFRVALTTQQDLNIHAEVGIAMQVLMWLATALVSVAFLVHVSMMCACASRRDITSGRREMPGERDARMKRFRNGLSGGKSLFVRRRSARRAEGDGEADQ